VTSFGRRKTSLAVRGSVIALSGLLFLSSAFPGFAGQRGQQETARPTPEQAPPQATDNHERPTTHEEPLHEEKPVVTHHEIRMGDRTLKYTATTGMMPLKDATGVLQADLFFVGYTLDGAGPTASRPLTFAFNGGPGAGSLWLHIGCIGPRRVRMQDNGGMPAPPYRLDDNPNTWLDQTDLVFIDPVGTGFSRAAKPDLNSKFFGLNGDIQSVGEFIRLYLDHYERWSSPLFLAGESYGTTRAAGLSGYLIEHGIAFNGIALISTVLNFQTLEFHRGNDLPYVLFLPTYAATAWYHKKLPPDAQSRDLASFVDEVEKWAAGDYTIALQKGDLLSAEERQSVIDRLARYTGLDKATIDDANLRIDGSLFEKQLLHAQKITVGRLDSRFVGLDESALGINPDFDPSLVAIRPPFTAAFNDYVRTELGYKSDAEYYALGGGVGRWDFGTNNGYADTSQSLRSAFAKNPDMKLFVAMGYYDLATPFFAVKYTLGHMGINSPLRGNISFGYYEAGHMMYIDNRAISKLRKDVGTFIESASHSAASSGINAPAIR
jgi:carboxypeptidase C (cathepsin A)